MPKDIRVLALDVDGVLTDGTITFDPATNSEMKTFHVHDGQGISMWKNAGYEVILISGRDAQVVKLRANELGITYVLQGSRNKIKDLHSALDQIGASPEQTAFVGDDLGDLTIMKHVGYAIAVNNAAVEVKEIANWVTPNIGGHGAVRDAIEHLMKAAKTWNPAVEALDTETAHQ